MLNIIYFIILLINVYNININFIFYILQKLTIYIFVIKTLYLTMVREFSKYIKILII